MDTKVGTQVQFMTCPKCKKNIMTCGRYLPKINQVLNDVNEIKKIMIGKEKEFQDKAENCKKVYTHIKTQLSSQDRTIKYFQKLDSRLALLSDKDIDKAIKDRDATKLNQFSENLAIIKDLLTLSIYNENLAKAQRPMFRSYISTLQSYKQPPAANSLEAQNLTYLDKAQ